MYGAKSLPVRVRKSSTEYRYISADSKQFVVPQGKRNVVYYRSKIEQHENH